MHSISNIFANHCLCCSTTSLNIQMFQHVLDSLKEWRVRKKREELGLDFRCRKIKKKLNFNRRQINKMKQNNLESRSVCYFLLGSGKMDLVASKKRVPVVRIFLHLGVGLENWLIRTAYEDSKQTTSEITE